MIRYSTEKASAIHHMDDNGSALCGYWGKKNTKYPTLVTCKICLKLKPLVLPEAKAKRKITPQVSPERCTEIYSQFLSGKNNSLRELAVKFDVSIHQAKAVIEMKMKSKLS